MESLKNLLEYCELQVQRIESRICPSDFCLNGQIELRNVCFYRIKRLSFDEDYPHREAFENVLLAMDSSSFNFVYILSEENLELSFILALFGIRIHRRI